MSRCKARLIEQMRDWYRSHGHAEGRVPAGNPTVTRSSTGIVGRGAGKCGARLPTVTQPIRTLVTLPQPLPTVTGHRPDTGYITVIRTGKYRALASVAQASLLFPRSRSPSALSSTSSHGHRTPTQPLTHPAAIRGPVICDLPQLLVTGPPPIHLSPSTTGPALN